MSGDTGNWPVKIWNVGSEKTPCSSKPIFQHFVQLFLRIFLVRIFLSYDTLKGVKLHFFVSLNIGNLWTWKYIHLCSFFKKKCLAVKFWSYDTLKGVKLHFFVSLNIGNLWTWKYIHLCSFFKRKCLAVKFLSYDTLKGVKLHFSYLLI